MPSSDLGQVRGARRAAVAGAVLALGAAQRVLAATPSPTAVPGGDPRSPGQGPGLVGDPVFAIGVVLALAVATVIVVLAYVRATAGSAGGSGVSAPRTGPDARPPGTRRRSG